MCVCAEGCCGSIVMVNQSCNTLMNGPKECSLIKPVPLLMLGGSGPEREHDTTVVICGQLLGYHIQRVSAFPEPSSWPVDNRDIGQCEYTITQGSQFATFWVLEKKSNPNFLKSKVFL